MQDQKKTRNKNENFKSMRVCKSICVNKTKHAFCKTKHASTKISQWILFRMDFDIRWMCHWTKIHHGVWHSTSSRLVSHLFVIILISAVLTATLVFISLNWCIFWFKFKRIMIIFENWNENHKISWLFESSLPFYRKLAEDFE